MTKAVVNLEERRLRHRIAQRKYYYRHRKEVLARVRAYQKANAEHDAEVKRKWYVANLERERSKARERRRKARLSNPERLAKSQRKWYYAHLERNRATARERQRKARLKAKSVS
jgi:hypothetical protein